MNDTPIKTIEQVRQFLNGVGAIEFSSEGKDARYAWIQTLLRRFHYHQLGKAEKGLLLDFLQKVSGYSRIQSKRLSQHSLQPGHLQRRQRTVQGFRRIYTLADIRVLAQTDELHGTLSGPATKKLCEQAWTHFGQTEYHRLAGISVAYLYILRKRYPYEAMMTPYVKFTSLPQPEQYLKPGRTLQQLDDMATAISDNEAAYQLNAAELKLYQRIFEQKPRTA